MNKQELFEKALAEFDVWPYDTPAMIYLHSTHPVSSHQVGDFATYWYDDDSNLVTEYWAFVCTRDEFEAAKAEKKAKAVVKEDVPKVFTKAMYDAGELPEVGMLFKYGKHEGRLVTSLVDGNNCVVCMISGAYHIIDEDYIYPINTRTPEQEIVDTLTTYFEEAMATEDTHPSFYAEGLFERIENGEFAGLRLEEDPS